MFSFLWRGSDKQSGTLSRGRGAENARRSGRRLRFESLENREMLTAVSGNVVDVYVSGGTYYYVKDGVNSGTQFVAANPTLQVTGTTGGSAPTVVLTDTTGSDSISATLSSGLITGGSLQTVAQIAIQNIGTFTLQVKTEQDVYIYGSASQNNTATLSTSGGSQQFAASGAIGGSPAYAYIEPTSGSSFFGEVSGFKTVNASDSGNDTAYFYTHGSQEFVVSNGGTLGAWIEPIGGGYTIMATSYQNYYASGTSTDQAWIYDYYGGDVSVNTGASTTQATYGTHNVYIGAAYGSIDGVNYGSAYDNWYANGGSFNPYYGNWTRH